MRLLEVRNVLYGINWEQVICLLCSPLCSPLGSPLCSLLCSLLCSPLLKGLLLKMSDECSLFIWDTILKCFYITGNCDQALTLM